MNNEETSKLQKHIFISTYLTHEQSLTYGQSESTLVHILHKHRCFHQAQHHHVSRPIVISCRKDLPVLCCKRRVCACEKRVVLARMLQVGRKLYKEKLGKTTQEGYRRHKKDTDDTRSLKILEVVLDR